jgi:hypothetical protein
LQFIESQPIEQRNPHWQLMSILNIDHLISCNFIGSVENFNDDIAVILKILYPAMKNEKSCSTVDLGNKKGVALLQNSYRCSQMN